MVTMKTPPLTAVSGVAVARTDRHQTTRARVREKSVGGQGHRHIGGGGEAGSKKHDDYDSTHSNGE